MAEFHVAPNGPDAMQVGTIIDANGQRFIGLSFVGEDGDRALITMLIPDFVALSEHMSRTAEKVQTRDFWRHHPRE